MKNKNLYLVLELNRKASDKEIKTSYRKLSFIYHPDKNIGNLEAEDKFKEITEAYRILSNEKSKNDYDSKSKFGKNYDESLELFDIDIDFSYEDEKRKFETFKKNEIWNIQIEIDEKFNGSLEYERWVKCKTCDGTGKDLSSKIIIRDDEGNITKIFDADDGCDYCEGTGTDHNENSCYFCQGQGKIGMTDCNKCKGEKRILGKQKLNGIKLTGNETKLDSMGHFAKNEPGKVGYLLLLKKEIV